MALLEYENHIFLDSFQEDGLTVLARGLGIQRIFLNFLKVYSDPGSLILVLNTSSSDENYFLEQLEAEAIKPLPKVITNEINANTRQSTYLQGGVLFITSRILVVDLLTDRVPIDSVSGILVYKAHKIIESCQEAFILRLYRQKNKTGFIKAFSDSPYSFTTGFCHVERMMKNLFVRRLFLWPRFHVSVVACFERHEVEVVEIHLHMTPSMIACQIALLDLINACIKELKRCTTAVDTEEVTVENALGKSFEKTIRMQLDPIWDSLGLKTKQLVSDLKTLRLVLKFLTQYDCVSFYSLVHSIRTSEKTFGQNTGWLFLDAADSLFIHAKDRVYGVEEKKKKQKTDDDTRQDKIKIQKEPVLEDCPKWQALSDLLKEIEKENKTADRADGPTNVLVCAEDDRTCSQLKEYLCEGGQSILARLYNKFVALRGAQQTEHEKFKCIRKKGDNLKDKEEVTELTLTQMMTNIEKQEDGDLKQDSEKDNSPYSSQDAYYGVISAPVTILHPLHGCTDPHGLTRVLQEVQPRYVILYDADMQLVRQLEVFRASQPGVPLRVYFLMYKNSVEEQCYLTTLRKEKEAFEHLIQQKGKMVIEEQSDGKLDDVSDLGNETTSTSSRKGGLQGKLLNRKVIVDMREFRSELPSLIHRRGINIEPVTLEVGDYILTPEICVERKSISDLIGSLGNGRLYNQCIAMCRFYKRPILLIEFDTNKSFSLQGKYSLSNDVSMKDVSSQLALLTMHFPVLRILWCASPYATAELIDELKENRNEPDSAAALSVTAAESTDVFADRYSHAPQDFLLKMPGVNSKNFRYIMNKVKDLAQLVTLSEDKLSNIMGSSQHAKLLYDFMHKNIDEVEKATAEQKKNEKPFKKGFGYKRKR